MTRTPLHRDALNAAHLRQHMERKWTQQTIVAAFLLFHERVGRAPATVDFSPSPSRLRGFSPERLREHQAVVALGIDLPQTDAIIREFGSVRAALRLAGFADNVSGLGRRRESSPVAVRSEAVCPSCGEFVTALHDRSGWCLACTSRREPHLFKAARRCSGCGGEFSNVTSGCVPCHDRQRKRRRLSSARRLAAVEPLPTATAPAAEEFATPTRGGEADAPAAEGRAAA